MTGWKIGSYLIVFISILVGFGCSKSDAPYVPFAPTHPSAIHAGTYAQDHRNVPSYANLYDYDYVSLSPRAQINGGPVGGTPAAENLIAQGVKVLFVTFPCYFQYNGMDLPVGDQERDIEDLAKRYNAVLRRLDNGQPQFAYGCFVLDFRNRAFVDALVQFWLKRAAIANGILLHEACGGIPTEDPQDPFYYPTTSQAELDWGDGYQYYVSELRRHRPDWEVIAVCPHWDTTGPGIWRQELLDGLFFENVPTTLNPVGMQTFNSFQIGTRD